MISKRFLIFILGTLAAISSLPACERIGTEIDVIGADGKKTSVKVSETLRVRIASEPPSLDWNKLSDSTSSLIVNNIMDGLVKYNLASKELELIPALAKKWETSEKARKWKFELRDDVKWSDGVPFEAKHVTDSWRRTFDRKTGSTYGAHLFGIKNARAFSEGKVSWEEVGVKTPTPYTIEVELENSMSYFPYLLTHASTYPIRLDVIQKHGPGKWYRPINMVTLGAFKLLSWEHDRIVVLTRNDDYYGTKPLIKNVAYYMIQEVATAVNLFDSGRIDVVDMLPSVELRKLRKRPEYRETPTMSSYYYGMNVNKPPMNNPLVRRAIAHAINRDEIVQMLAGGQRPLTNWIPFGMFGHDPERGLKFDPKKAQELLKEAGYSNPSQVPRVEIRFNTNDDHLRIAENIQAQLKRNLGINIELKNEEWKVYLSSVKTDAPMIFRMGWSADFPDPHNFFQLLLSYSESNYSRWKNPRYDELIEKGAAALEKTERLKYYTEAQKLLVEEAVPVIPIYTRIENYMISSRVENYPVNVLTKRIYNWGVTLKGSSK